MSQPPTSGLSYAAASSLAYANAEPRAFFGIVETTVQALRLAYAARQGVVPRIIRRLNRKERKEWIVSGSIFVFDVKESGIQRWTDGRLWTPSRIVGNFLVYREMNERTSGKGHLEECTSGDGRGGPSGTQSQRRRRRSGSAPAAADEGLKIMGLMKKVIRIHNLDYHLISYYTQEDLDLGRFSGVSSRSDIMALDLPPQVFHFSDFRHPPRVEAVQDGQVEIVCDPEPTEPLMHAADNMRNDFSCNPSEQIDGVIDDTSGWDWAPAAPAVPLPQTSGMMTSSDHLRRDSWQQEQFESTETLQENLQQIHRSSSVPSETHFGHSRNNSGHNRHGSLVYPPQAWSSPTPPNHSTYMPAASSSNANLHSFQMGVQDMAVTGEGSSASGSGNGGTRHNGQSQPIWLPANQNTVLQGSNSGALYIHSMPSSSLYSPAAQHAYGLPAPDLDEGTSSAVSHYPLNFAATLACAGQSPSQNPYVSAPCPQSYDIECDEMYEYYQSMHG